LSSPALRPTDWDQFVGQEKLKERLEFHIDAAIDRNDMLAHLLLVGPPGTGKTSLARLVAKKLQVEIRSYVMPIKMKVLQKAIENYTGTLFLDEIHRMSRKDQECLLPVLEDGFWQLDNGSRQAINGRLTVIGATTEPEKIISPLHDRFIIRPRFEEYTNAEMALIVKKMADKLGMPISQHECDVFGKASAGVPRQARTIVMAARDLKANNPEEVLRICSITHDGLTEHHIAYLVALHELGMLAGVDLLVNQLRLPKEIILATEALLVKKRMIEYTSKGRQLNVAGSRVVEEIISGKDPIEIEIDENIGNPVPEYRDLSGLNIQNLEDMQ
jgi:Holliday junction DNA helicase RuvB